jgi:nifR3 family TIM-barrel protein
MINYGFWKQLNKPIFAVAPMADVTDAAFRRMIATYGKPDVMWTEFVSCDGMCSAGKEVLVRDLLYDASERPIVAQIFGATPEHFYRTAQMVQELGFDGIDINMGCPDKNIQKQNAGAKLIQHPQLAQEIIRETKRGAGALPVSVKTRIGYTKNTIDEWLPYILEAEPAAITIHGRTKKEMSDVPAHWDVIAHGVELTERYYGKKDRPFVLGNGDVRTLAEAFGKVRDYGVDGVMVGRGLFGNPWFFADKDALKRGESVELKDITIEKKIQAMLEHTELFVDLFGEHKRFDIMKKHYKAYIGGFDGARELRVKLMAAHDVEDVRRILKKEGYL